MSDCKICKKPDNQKPMTFRGEAHCSELHRKVLAGEIPQETLDAHREALSVGIPPQTNENSVVE